MEVVVCVYLLFSFLGAQLWSAVPQLDKFDTLSKGRGVPQVSVVVDGVTVTVRFSLLCFVLCGLPGEGRTSTRQKKSAPLLLSTSTHRNYT